MKTVLLTGAAGDVANRLRPMLRDRYRHLVLSDRREVADLAANEEFRGGNLDDPAAMEAACAGVDGIIHLGGQPIEASWEIMDASNIRGMIVLMEAARKAGTRRVVFASSNHAIGMYPRNRRITPENRVRPDTRYGLSKAFGEALCALYADKHGMRCLSIRIGHVIDVPTDLCRLSIWLHTEDLIQLVVIGLEHPDLHHEVVFGCSDNAMGFWDNGPAFALGYRPQHKAEDYRDIAMAGQATLPPDPIGDRLQGGEFSSIEFDGDIERTVWS